MPLIKREVEPILVSQVDIGKDVSNELECVTNFTLSSIIRQLGNLGKHAEDIFGDLLQEAMGMSLRAKNLQNRLDTLGNTVNLMNPLTDSVSQRDINTRLAFKSNLALDIEVVASPTMPSAMRETYMRCEKPPPLSDLNKFREDGKDGLKLYTDPKFFFERWCTEQVKEIKKKKKKMKRPASKIGKGEPTKVVKSQRHGKGKGKELDDIEREKPAHRKSVHGKTTNQGGINGDTGLETVDETSANGAPTDPSDKNRMKNMPRGVPPPPPPPLAGAPGTTHPQQFGDSGGDVMPPPPPEDDLYSIVDYGSIGVSDILPPPPPPVPAGLAHLPPQPPPVSGQPLGPGPAPPPPPPLPNMNGLTPQPAPMLGPGSRVSTANVSQVEVSDTRNDLLSAIKNGMQLRKVVVTEDKQRNNEPAENSVEAILRRRIAMEGSSEEDNDSQSSSDDSEWDDDDD